MSDTRCRCRMPDSTTISVWNSGIPCCEARVARFTATGVPSPSTPLYTFPNPPTPMRLRWWKLSVAALIFPSEMCSFVLTLSIPPVLRSLDHRFLNCSAQPEAPSFVYGTAKKPNTTQARTAALSTADTVMTNILFLPPCLVLKSTGGSLMISSPFSMPPPLLFGDQPMLTVRFPALSALAA
ncbi:unnamed protein product [Triticum turgidum subsp. durum]|uniref:Uncharacterized protein n=1 Tax=Triticum turgidum subsp. durum TaxID=4567 RepID=A0A9R0TF69_TRITD|nr:unnamed protein product [Triticum turgidum subsp. durum]